MESLSEAETLIKDTIKLYKYYQIFNLVKKINGLYLDVINLPQNLSLNNTDPQTTYLHHWVSTMDKSSYRVRILGVSCVLLTKDNFAIYISSCSMIFCLIP